MTAAVVTGADALPSGGVLSVACDGPVTTLILNRPDKRNALSASLVEALTRAVGEAASDGTRLLVLRGAGKVFCAGFDFAGVAEQAEAELVHRFIRIELLLQAIHHAPFATLALAHGACYGAGADLFCACQRRVAAPGTRFRMPGLAFGIALGTGRLAEAVGPVHARALLESSAVFDAERGERIGFATAVKTVEEWPDAIGAASEAATALQPESVQMLNGILAGDRRDADLAALVRSASVPGLKERILAFLRNS